MKNFKCEIIGLILISKIGSGFAWTILSIKGKGKFRENR